MGVTYIPYPSLQMSDEPKIRRWEHTNTAKNALRKLQDAYEYDCYDGPCYAYYTLRTEAQDSNPKTDDISQICDIETAEDGWYIVSYLDMGWSGKTRVKIVDGKIDDYERISSDLPQ